MAKKTKKVAKKATKKTVKKAAKKVTKKKVTKKAAKKKVTKAKKYSASSVKKNSTNKNLNLPTGVSAAQDISTETETLEDISASVQSAENPNSQDMQTHSSDDDFDAENPNSVDSMADLDIDSAVDDEFDEDDEGYF